MKTTTAHIAIQTPEDVERKRARILGQLRRYHTAAAAAAEKKMEVAGE